MDDLQRSGISIRNETAQALWLFAANHDVEPPVIIDLAVAALFQRYNEKQIIESADANQMSRGHASSLICLN